VRPGRARPHRAPRRAARYPAARRRRRRCAPHPRCSGTRGIVGRGVEVRSRHRGGLRWAPRRSAPGGHRAREIVEVSGTALPRWPARRRGGPAVVALLVAGAFSLVFTLFTPPLWLRLFKRLGWGQFIRDDGPQSHHTKRGTPTMG